MKRTEQREHIFKMLFGVEFNAGGDMPEQLELYFGQLEGAGEKDLDYIREKVQKIASKVEEIDALINEHTTRWKTSRMNKVDLTILRLARGCSYRRGHRRGCGTSEEVQQRGRSLICQWRACKTCRLIRGRL